MDENIEKNDIVDNTNDAKESTNSSEVVEEKKKENKAWQKTKKISSSIWNYIIKTSGGMALGLFATLIIGTIINQIGTWINFPAFAQVGKVLQGFMGIGIGLGVAYGTKDLRPLNLISLGAVGGIASAICYNPETFECFFIKSEGLVGSSNPLTVYLVVICALELEKLILRKKTPVDLLIVPLTICVLGVLFSYAFVIPCQYIINGISTFVDNATTYAPFLMGVVVCVVMGMALTAPISSVAISVAINLSGIAAGAACVGCCVNMVGFAIQSIKDNKIGKVLAVGIGTSMLQWQNVLRKPLIWLPTIITSAILGPISTMAFKMECNAIGGGMGTCALIGPIQVIANMPDNPGMAWAAMLTLCIFGPMILVGLIDFIFRKLKWIKDGDLAI